MAQFGRTWWGERFLHALEQFTDRGRLNRGRAYATNGRVKTYDIRNGTVNAKVRGSVNPYFGIDTEPLYTTTITITQFDAADWKKAIAHIGARADLVTKLLQGEMPDTIEDVFAEDGLNLLPQSQNEFRTHCSCPDWDNPCKHIAGVYYLLARDLDRDPFVLFELRGLARTALHAGLVKTPLGQTLAASLQPKAIPLTPAASFYTRPTKVGRASARTNGTPTPSTNAKKKVGAEKAPGTPAKASDTPINASGTPVNASSTPVTHRTFWTGPRRLQPTRPVASSQARVSALLVKKQGDNPPFWNKDSSFLKVMEEFYDRVRTKSPQLK